MTALVILTATLAIVLAGRPLVRFGCWLIRTGQRMRLYAAVMRQAIEERRRS